LMRLAKPSIAKGFVRICHLWRQAVRSHRRFLGISCDEEHFEIRSRYSPEIGKLPPVHATGQADVRDEQVDTCVRAQDLEGARAVSRFEGSIAKLAEYLGDKHSNRGLVVDDERRLTCTSARRRREISQVV
jgi:hypothetical protein